MWQLPEPVVPVPDPELVPVPVPAPVPELVPEPACVPVPVPVPSWPPSVPEGEVLELLHASALMPSPNAATAPRIQVNFTDFIG